MILLVSMSSITTLSATENDSIVATATTKEVPADVSKLLTRLDEINAMDKTALNRLQKKELRKEVRVIKSELKEKRHGVYISVGAFIIIILLLVILL